MTLATGSVTLLLGLLALGTAAVQGGLGCTVADGATVPEAPAAADDGEALDAGEAAPAEVADESATVAPRRATVVAQAEPTAEPKRSAAAEPKRSAAAEPAEPEAEPETGAVEQEEGYWVGPPEVIADCNEQLDASGVSFAASRIPLHETRAGYFCGAEQIVRYAAGPGEIKWSSPPKVTCAVALGMAKLEQIVQEEAVRHFDKRVAKIKHMGTYNCREMANYPGWVSEHSYANAIDIMSFTLRGGTTISVLDDYAKSGTEAKTAKAKFLRAVARRLYDEGVFSVVLTPSFDRAHRNHFHLDQARYKVDGV